MANEVEVHIGQEHYKTTITNGRQSLAADKPADQGGADKGLDPGDLFLASLGSCKAMTMRMYADRKGWPLAEATVKLSLAVVKSERQQTTYIRCHIELAGDLEDGQRARLLDIADKCPMHKIMAGNIEIDTNLLP